MSQSIKVTSNTSKLIGQTFKSIGALGNKMENDESVTVHQVDTVDGATKDVGYRVVTKDASGKVTFTRPTKDLPGLTVASEVQTTSAPIVKEALVQARKELGNFNPAVPERAKEIMSLMTK